MNPKLAAEIYILSTIDEVDEVTEKRFTGKLKGTPFSTIDEFVEMYEQEESITEDLVAWIQDEWEAVQQANPRTSAAQFAKSRVPDFLSALE